MKNLYGGYRSERDIVKFTEDELAKDEKYLDELMNKYPVVANAIAKLRAEVLQLRNEKAVLKDRVNKLEREIITLQHEWTPYHDLGQ